MSPISEEAPQVRLTASRVHEFAKIQFLSDFIAYQFITIFPLKTEPQPWQEFQVVGLAKLYINLHWVLELSAVNFGLGSNLKIFRKHLFIKKKIRN